MEKGFNPAGNGRSIRYEDTVDEFHTTSYSPNKSLLGLHLQFVDLLLTKFEDGEENGIDEA